MASGHVRIRVEITNPRAVEAFAEACCLVRQAADEYPWSCDLQEACELLRRAAAGLTPQQLPP